MRRTGIRAVQGPRFLITGALTHKKLTCKEGLAILNVAWRCLYAEITHARIEETEPDLHKALKRMLAMIISRVTAHGEKWRRWYLANRHTTRGRLIAKRYRNYKLITTDQHGKYEVNPTMQRMYDVLKQMDS